LTREELLTALLEDAERAYAVREAELTEIGGETAMRQLERSVLLTTIDRKWREHLYEMDYLKEGIGLRAMAQRDPLVEYQREGFDMFNGMLDALKEESVGFLFNLQVERAPEPDAVQPSASDVPGLARNGNGHVQDSVPGQNGQAANGQATRSGRHAAVPPPQPASVDGHVPPALRGKGLGAPATGGQQRLTYSGPAEAGGVESQTEDDGDADGSGTRRERREQARAKAKSGKKRPRR
jgi:preprotein translocase subunit SecA